MVVVVVSLSCLFRNRMVGGLQYLRQCPSKGLNFIMFGLKMCWSFLILFSVCFYCNVFLVALSVANSSIFLFGHIKKATLVSSHHLKNKQSCKYKQEGQSSNHNSKPKQLKIGKLGQHTNLYEELRSCAPKD